MHEPPQAALPSEQTTSPALATSALWASPRTSGVEISHAHTSRLTTSTGPGGAVQATRNRASRARRIKSNGAPPPGLCQGRRRERPAGAAAASCVAGVTTSGSCWGGAKNCGYFAEPCGKYFGDVSPRMQSPTNDATAARTNTSKIGGQHPVGTCLSSPNIWNGRRTKPRHPFAPLDAPALPFLPRGTQSRPVSQRLPIARSFGRKGNGALVRASRQGPGEHP